MLLGRPIIEATPSGLRKITRFTKLDPDSAKVANLGTTFPAYGTADAEFTTALLVDQRIDRRTEMGANGTLIQVYQELAVGALTATTDVTESTTFDGRRVTRTLYLCKTTDADGLRPAIGSGSPAVFQVDVEKSGPVAKMTVYRIEITNSGFVYSQQDDTKNNGKLLLRTIRTLAAVAGTPAGYVATGTSTQIQDGYTIYTANFAKGDGEISRDVDYGQSSDQGTTGVTKTTIRHLTASSVDADPTTLAGSVKVGEGKSDADGYRVWTIVYAKGTGEVSRETSSRFNGMLQRITIRHLTATSVSTQPTTDPFTTGGLVVDEAKSDQEGYRLWTVTWAKAFGTALVRDDVEKKSQGKLIIYRRSRFNAAPAAPSATIGGTVVEISSGTQLEDGYTLYIMTWAEGVGTIDDSISYRNKGKLVLYKKTALGAAPAEPAATIGGTVVLVQDDSRDSDGVTVYDRTWAEGVGTITNDVQQRHSGKLVIYHKVAMGVAPSAPSATISGTVTLTQDDSREDNGVTIYDRTWAEGVGIIGESTQTRAGGLRLLNRDILLAPGGTDITAYNPTAGILVEKSYTDLDGYRRWSATWAQKHDGTSPITGTPVATEAWMPFTYPGRAKTFSVAFTAGSYTSHRARDVYLAPPVQSLVLATTTITYQTSNAVGSLANTLWNPTDWATLRARWIAWANSPRSKVEGLRGYRTVGHDVTGVASTDVITANGGTIAHGFANTDQVSFRSLSGGAGLTASTVYYVRDVTTYTFKLAATSGGAAIDFTTDITTGELQLVGGTSGGAGLDTAVLGDRVYASTDWKIEVAGGPTNPGGSTWTLSAAVDPEPAFIAYDGTKYYRLVVVTATPAAQTALPV